MTELRSMIWMAHVARMGKMKNVHNILSENLKREKRKCGLILCGSGWVLRQYFVNILRDWWEILLSKRLSASLEGHCSMSLFSVNVLLFLLLHKLGGFMFVHPSTVFLLLGTPLICFSVVT
jgi:hypothetical protein